VYELARVATYPICESGRRTLFEPRALADWIAARAVPPLRADDRDDDRHPRTGRLGRCSQRPPRGVVGLRAAAEIVGEGLARGWRQRYRRCAMGEIDSQDHAGQRTRRREARQIIGAYHDEQLRALLEHVRDGFARLDRGELDAFELDDLIHRYRRSAQKLWTFCGSGGADWERAVSALEFAREQGEEPDWWQAGGAPRRRHAN
jgi:hypothetical protein